MKKYLIDEDSIGGYVGSSESWVQVLEDALEELPPGSKVLTRGHVEDKLLDAELGYSDTTPALRIKFVLDELFGDAE